MLLKLPFYHLYLYFNIKISSLRTQNNFIISIVILYSAWLISCNAPLNAQNKIPFLKQAPVIDGDLSEWKEKAFSDGIWNLERVKSSSWYEPKRNKLIVHEHEDSNQIDLQATYYIAWDNEYIYLGAEVTDNINDTMDAKHEPKRWYYKDAIAWFFETPCDSVSESFGDGDHAFCFVIDDAMPEYGAWWRHGNAKESYIEEPIPQEGRAYAIQMNPWNQNEADYILEAKVHMKTTLGKDSENWTSPENNECIRMMIVHCDPDGAEYGGHLLIYGKGDNDSTWMKAQFVK